MTSLLPWLAASATTAENSGRPHSEAQLTLPDFHQVKLGPLSGWNLLAIGLAVSALGLLFGLIKYQKLKNLPAHKAMIEISELIYSTCKTYLKTQAKFIFQLWILIAAVIVVYFAVLEKPHVPIPKVACIAAFSVVGIDGKKIGETPAVNIKLNPGKHAVRAVSPSGST